MGAKAGGRGGLGKGSWRRRNVFSMAKRVWRVDGMRQAADMGDWRRVTADFFA